MTSRLIREFILATDARGKVLLPVNSSCQTRKLSLVSSLHRCSIFRYKTVLSNNSWKGNNDWFILNMCSKFIYFYTYIIFYKIYIYCILGVVSKQLILLRGRGFTAVVDSLIWPSEEIAGPGCYWFLPRWYIVEHFELIRVEFQKFVELKFEIFGFNIFDFLWIFRQRVVQARLKHRDCIFWDCARFLFVGYSITHCGPCQGCFLVFILCPIVKCIFGTICCIIF